MLATLRDAWRIPEIRKKMIFTLLMLLVYRLGSAIPVPYMNKELIQAVFTRQEGTFLQMLDMLAGGNFSQFTIFAANIGPYITASIIIQLLTIAIPALEERAKDGEAGKKFVQKLTRYGAVVLALVQAVGFTFGIFRSAIEPSAGALQKLIIIMSVVAGSVFLIWVGDQISEKGVGNGISLLIFIGIISRIPHDILRSAKLIQAGQLKLWLELIYVIIVILIVAFVVRLNEGERRVPVQYAKRVVGRKMYGGQATNIPIKVSMAGVMPVIFSTSILSIPSTIAAFTNSNGAFAQFVAKWFSPNGSIGVWFFSIFNILLIMFFSYFYTTIQFNTVEYAKNLQQNGGFIPGIRPGRPTSDYLGKVVNRLVFVGGVSLALLATIPTILLRVFGMPANFGGTSIIIVVGVALETVKSIEQQMLIRHYKGFLK